MDKETVVALIGFAGAVAPALIRLLASLRSENASYVGGVRSGGD